jgi:uncharacterized membrane protein (UPF0136 family)
LRAQGHAVALGASSVLAAGMGHRAIKTKKAMPAGVIAGVGLLSAIYHAKKTVEWS